MITTHPTRPRLRSRMAAHLAIPTLIVALGAPANAQSFLDELTDPTDGYLDGSGWFAKKGAFMPVPIIITEPAVGAGGGLAAVWFHGKEKRDDPWAEPPPGTQFAPPSVSVLGGVATSNGTWAAFGGHFGSWKEDSVRYKGGLGIASANLDYYVGSKDLRYNIDSRFLVQDLRFRAGESSVFLGARYAIGLSEASFDVSGLPPGVEAPSLDADNASLGPVLAFDNRDNLFTPTAGTAAKLHYGFYNEAFGGDFNYDQLEVEATHHFSLDEDERWIVGARGLASVVEREAPFYAKPYVQLRGVPALRFQGDQALSVEGELRYQFHTRWSALGFVGLGGARYESDVREDEGLVVAGGLGFRYKLARLLGLHAGLDLAMGPEGPVIYIQVGSGL